jgi:hypothetical protein
VCCFAIMNSWLFDLHIRYVYDHMQSTKEMRLGNELEVGTSVLFCYSERLAVCPAHSLCLYIGCHQFLSSMFWDFICP